MSPTRADFCFSSAPLDHMLAALPSTPNPRHVGTTKSLTRTMEDQNMKGNDILDGCRRLNQISDELAAMVDEEIKRGEDGDTDDDGQEHGQGMWSTWQHRQHAVQRGRSASTLSTSRNRGRLKP